jgi:hypothetical protein
MKKSMSLILLLSLLLAYSYAQQFYPLKTGNKFVYSYSSGGSYDGQNLYNSSINIIKVIKDSIIRSKKYYLVTTIPYNYGGTSTWVRVDSITGSLYCYDTSNSCQYYNYEDLIDSLAISSGSENLCTNISGGSSWRLYNSGNTIVYGYSTIYKEFSANLSYYTTVRRIYNSKFGLSSYHLESHSGTSSYYENNYLKGCIINDTLYGDTITTLINIISNNTPDKYSLSQNYPNPFNPSTNIKYQVKDNSFVTLKIFDILGKEVATLVNEKQSPGTYETQFPNNLITSNQLPSGIYFYSLFVDGDKIDTKKMVLLK